MAVQPYPDLAERISSDVIRRVRLTVLLVQDIAVAVYVQAVLIYVIDVFRPSILYDFVYPARIFDYLLGYAFRLRHRQAEMLIVFSVKRFGYAGVYRRQYAVARNIRKFMADGIRLYIRAYGIVERIFRYSRPKLGEYRMTRYYAGIVILKIRRQIGSQCGGAVRVYILCGNAVANRRT